MYLIKKVFVLQLIINKVCLLWVTKDHKSYIKMRNKNQCKKELINQLLIMNIKKIKIN
jgi:hypothetical protein